MEEAQAIIGILVITAISLSAYFVFAQGQTGMAGISESYVACCCNILVNDGNQFLVRNQIQMFADDCNDACRRYQDSTVGDKGTVFPQEGLCWANP